jgi:hypothetical protein
MAKKKLHIPHLTNRKFFHTIFWSLIVSGLIVGAAAAIGRASHNMNIALEEKPDIALYILLPEEEIGKSTLLRESENERDYLAETKDGPKFVKLKKGKEQWYAALVESLHEGGDSTHNP